MNKVDDRACALVQPFALTDQGESATSPEEIITRVVEQVRAETACDAVAAVYDHRFVTSVNITVCPFPKCDDTGHLHVLDGPGRHVLERAPVRIDDTWSDHRWTRWTTQVAAQGFRSTWSIGVRRAGRVYGSLTLLKHKPRGFTPNDAAKVSQLAADAALALEGTLAERRARNGSAARTLAAVK